MHKHDARAGGVQTRLHPSQVCDGLAAECAADVAEEDHERRRSIGDIRERAPVRGCGSLEHGAIGLTRARARLGDVAESVRFVAAPRVSEDQDDRAICKDLLKLFEEGNKI